MREIKFRAWDKATNTMIVTGFHVFGEYTLFNLIEIYLIEHPMEGKEHLERFNDVEIMQFTGLPDKNGKEIYEGDICRFFWNPILNEPSEIFEAELPVTYYTGWGCFVFHWQSKKMKKKQRELFEDYGRREIFVAIGSPIMYGDGVEVIGNIYENPELLKPTTDAA